MSQLALQQLFIEDPQSLEQKAKQFYSQSLKVSLSVEQAHDCQSKALEVCNLLEKDERYLTSALNLKARIYLDQSNIEDAQNVLKEALSLEPNNPSLLYSMGHVHIAHQRFSNAIALFNKAESISPYETRSKNALAYCFLATGHIDKAFQLYRTLDARFKDDEGIKQKLFDTCKKIQADYFQQELADDVLAYFDYEGVELQNLHNLFCSLIIKQFNLESTSNVNNQRSINLNELANNKLLIAGLKKLVIGNHLIESFVTSIRKKLLFACVVDTNQYKQFAQLICAISQQSINNEQVYYISNEEKQLVQSVQDVIVDDLKQNWQCQQISSALSLYAMYEPISTLPNWPSLMNQPINKWPNHLRSIINRSVFDLDKELLISKRFDSVITNKTSLKVKEQYEHHPYPRWLQLGFNTPTNYGRALELELKKFTAPEYFNQGTLNVLVAGCGTGQHAIRIAKYFRNTQVTAIDLSGRSLAYAEKMAEKLGLSNINFRQQDILDLDGQEKFHVIECSGVLHHMDDVSEGLSKLKKCLVDDGIIKLALYSKEARQSVAQLREVIRQKHIKPDIDGIRLFRWALINSGSHAFSPILNSLDFYSLSGCRDLLFHVSEICLSPMELKQIASENDLSFKGFVRLEESIKTRYIKKYPFDATLTNLENWQEFEKTQTCFGEMYQFYLQ